MDDFSNRLNDLLTQTFNTILKVEEMAIQSSNNIDLSMNEMHLIEVVGKESLATISTIAKKLDITLPSVTVAVNKLCHKKYLEKIKCAHDARSVRVKLSDRGEEIFHMHQYFHMQLIESISGGMEEIEKKALLNGIGKINFFFSQKIKELEM